MSKYVEGTVEKNKDSNDWKTTKLKDVICDFIVPMRDKPKEFNGDIPWCRIEDIEGKYLKDSLSGQYVSEEIIKEMNLKVHPKGTVICSCSARLGVCAILKRDIVTNQTFIGLVPGNNINKEFLYYCMIFNKQRLQTLSSGTTISYLSRKEFENFTIKIPRLNEQEKIAEILSTWDLVIEKQEQLIEKKKEFKKGLIQRLLNGEVRFKEFSDEWNEKEIGNFIEEYKEKSTVSNQYPVLTSSRSGLLLQTDYFKDNQVTTNDNIGYNVIPKDFITFRTRSDDGIFVFNQNKIIDKGIVSYFYPVFKFSEGINTYFAITWLNNFINKQIRREIVGTSQLVLSLNKLKKFRINLPSIEEQDKIAEVLKASDKEIELLEKELEALKLQKKGLMQRLLTGEVRVKV